MASSSRINSYGSTRSGQMNKDCRSDITPPWVVCASTKKHIYLSGICNQWASLSLRAPHLCVTFSTTLHHCYCAGKSRGKLILDIQRGNDLSSSNDDRCRNCVARSACDHD